MPVRVIDNFSLALTHGLLLLVAWRLLFRADLDREPRAQPDATEDTHPRFGARPRRKGGPGA